MRWPKRLNIRAKFLRVADVGIEGREDDLSSAGVLHDGLHHGVHEQVDLEGVVTLARTVDL